MAKKKAAGRAKKRAASKVKAKTKTTAKPAVAFEIRALGELVAERKRQPPRIVRLRRERVPASLQDLVPLAERYGMSDGVGRELAFRAALRPERTALKRALVGREDAIEDFLHDVADDQYTGEHAAFSNLLVFALEHLDGGGIRGKLDYATRRLRRDVWQALATFEGRIDDARALVREFTWLKRNLKEAEQLGAKVTRVVGARVPSR